MDTFLLDRSSWDLLVDAKGNIAMATNPYSQAQDAASAIKLFQGEAWYDTTRGVPYWAMILGLAPPLSLCRAKFETAALTVPETATALCIISSFTGRKLTGQVQISNTDNQSAVAGF